MRTARPSSGAIVLCVVLAISAVALVPAAARGHRTMRFGPRLSIVTNDDGTGGRLDPGDIGGTSVGYDRWGDGSSDDPAAAGMDPARVDADVARCLTVWHRGGVRVEIDNGYPGYVCSFVVGVTHWMGSGVRLEGILTQADAGIDIIEIDTPERGWRGRHCIWYLAAYAVAIEQEASAGDSLTFDISLELSDRRHR